MSENTTQKIEVKTALGTLVAYPSTDPNNPGIFIDLKRDGVDYDLGLAGVECQQGEDRAGGPAIVSHVWGDADDEDTTEDIVHTGIEDFFGGKVDDDYIIACDKSILETLKADLGNGQTLGGGTICSRWYDIACGKDHPENTVSVRLCKAKDGNATYSNSDGPFYYFDVIDEVRESSGVTDQCESFNLSDEALETTFGRIIARMATPAAGEKEKEPYVVLTSGEKATAKLYHTLGNSTNKLGEKISDMVYVAEGFCNPAHKVGLMLTRSSVGLDQNSVPYYTLAIYNGVNPGQKDLTQVNCEIRFTSSLDYSELCGRVKEVIAELMKTALNPYVVTVTPKEVLEWLKENLGYGEPSSSGDRTSDYYAVAKAAQPGNNAEVSIALIERTCDLPENERYYDIHVINDVTGEDAFFADVESFTDEAILAAVKGLMDGFNAAGFAETRDPQGENADSIWGGKD